MGEGNFEGAGCALVESRDTVTQPLLGVLRWGGTTWVLGCCLRKLPKHGTMAGRDDSPVVEGLMGTEAQWPGHDAQNAHPGLPVPEPLQSSCDACVSSCFSWYLGMTFLPRQPAPLSPHLLRCLFLLMGTLFTLIHPTLHSLQSPHSGISAELQSLL